MEAILKWLVEALESTGETKGSSRIFRRLAKSENNTRDLEGRLEKLERIPQAPSVDPQAIKQTIAELRSITQQIAVGQSRITHLEKELGKLATRANLTQAAVDLLREQQGSAPAARVVASSPNAPMLNIPAELCRNVIANEFNGNAGDKLSANDPASYRARLARLHKALRPLIAHQEQVGVAHLNLLDRSFGIRMDGIEAFADELTFQLFVVIQASSEEMLAFLPPGEFSSSRYPRAYRLLLDSVPDGNSTIEAIAKPARLRAQPDGTYRVEEMMALEAVEIC